jgi:hypothetical protein
MAMHRASANGNLPFALLDIPDGERQALRRMIRVVPL